MYSGKAGGTHYNKRGGASNYLCMPDDPDYGLAFRAGVQGLSPVGGAEYEQPLVSGHHNHNVPCAVCYVHNQTTFIMIPEKMNCPSGWTREYNGYLMSARVVTHYRTQFICMDSNMEAIPGLLANTNGAVFYHAEATCNGLSCATLKKNSTVWCALNSV